MPEGLLLPSQKRMILESCESVGLSPADFDFESRVGRDGAIECPRERIIHRPTDFYFELMQIERGTKTEYSPAQHQPITQNLYANVSAAIHAVPYWANYIIREWDALSYLNSLEDRSLIASVSSSPAAIAPFSDSELDDVRNRLEQIESYVLQVRVLNELEASIIRSRFDTLELELERAGRQGWLQMMVGSLISIVSSVYTSDQKVGQSVMSYATQTFSAVVQLLK